MIELTPPTTLLTAELDRTDLLLAALAVFEVSQIYEVGSAQRNIYESLAAKIDMAIAPAPGEIRQAFNEKWRNIKRPSQPKP